jgi:hypothetical protein
LSTSLIFNCLPDGSVRVGLKWQTFIPGLQWVDLSIYNNDFTNGAMVIGPVAPGQTALSWDGLAQGTWYFVRVNTQTDDGWMPSRPMAFLTPPDCNASASGYAYYPPPPPSHCLDLIPVTGPVGGCVWTAKADFGVYETGESVVYCYSISQPMQVRIIAFRPDGSTISIADRFDTGAGACIGPYQAALPRGLRSVAMYGGPDYQALSATHFYVR